MGIFVWCGVDATKGTHAKTPGHMATGMPVQCLSETSLIPSQSLPDTLTVKGSRTEEELPEGDVYHRRERACGSFSRAFTLPFEVEASSVDATFEQGILRITLPRAEAD